ncbi:MAG TPA: GNAT family N-acetyltransferase [Vicinamibacterales bacterium]|nr:GNAT family N-acetyltransferase [Vicinamibacterales bacterium]
MTSTPTRKDRASGTPLEIRALRESDDRTAFRSGDADLDRFFHQFAGQNQFRHHLGVTYVAVQGRNVLGYATVAAAHVEIEDLPPASRRKLPRYPLPVLRLARLAVDQSARGQGLGLQLLRFVLRLSRQMADEYGCVGVVVDAKPEAEAFYARYGFIAVDAVEGRSDARPVPTPMFLSMRAISDGIGESRPTKA